MWKDIIGFEGRYQINRDGCIRNVAKKHASDSKNRP
jgi:hypothetical protein